MPGPAEKHLGVSPPVTLQPSPEEGIRERPKMISALDNDFPAETEEGMRLRKDVMEHLDKLVNEWTYQFSITNAVMDEDSARAAGAKIFLFGSMKLGVVAPGSDIDCVCVVPKHIQRDHFFSHLVTKLQEDSNRDGFSIDSINLITEGHTPIIEMVINGIPVDLGFARLNLPTLQNVDSLLDDKLLTDMDDKSARSLGGNRVNEMILQLVPHKEAFREALRFIKSWGKARGLNSNKLGFFGGITWAIMVARICQLYPNFNSAMIVARFFKVYTRWDWGYNKPVLLQQIKHSVNTSTQTHHHANHLKVWDPRANIHDKQHLMPVITPAFPSMNSTHNVSESTRRTIIGELKRGELLINEILNKNPDVQWEDLYAKPDFFTEHIHFLRIIISGKTEEAYNRFEGFIESKLRRIILSIEQGLQHSQVRPWPEKFDFNVTNPAEWDTNKLSMPELQEMANNEKNILKDFPHTKQMFLGLTFSASHFLSNQQIDLRPFIEKFVDFITSIMRNEDYKMEQQDMFIFHVTRSALPRELVKRDMDRASSVIVTGEGQVKILKQEDDDENGMGKSVSLVSINTVVEDSSPTKKRKAGEEGEDLSNVVGQQAVGKRTRKIIQVEVGN